jgi:ATP-dependent DNA ligase
VVAGFRWHARGAGLVGSLLLGLHDDGGILQHVGVTSSFTMARRRELAGELAPLRAGALRGHPWADGARPSDGGRRVPGGRSRWSAGKDLSWEPVRPERVCEVRYDHLQGRRFRHAATFLRWRPDRAPADCRYDQLAVTPPYQLAVILGGGARPA